MSLTHRLFGIRSCNEVITGKREPAVPRVRHQALHRAVRRHDLLARGVRRARSRLTQLFLEGKNDELVKTLKSRMLDGRGRASGSRKRRSCAMRMRTVQTLHDRQQKMATAELGHRDVFGLKLGPAGVVVQVFQVRSGRVVERVELGTEEAIAGCERAARCSRRRIQQFYELRGAPPEIHVPAEPDEREALETLAVGARRPPRADRRAAARREARARRSRQPQRRARLSDALQPGDAPRSTTRSRRCSTCSRCRRCRAASSASTSPRFRAARPSRRWSCAKTAGCGGRSIGSIGLEDRGLGTQRSGSRSRASGLEPSVPSQARRLRGDARSRPPPLSQAARAGRAVSRSDR